MIYNKNHLRRFAGKQTRKSNYSKISRGATRMKRKMRY